MLKFRKETEFKDTEIGKVPREWEVKSIGEIALINPENLSKNDPFKKIEYIDVDSVEEGEIKGIKLIDVSSAPSRAKRKVRQKDIIFSTVRPALRHYAFIKNAKPNTIVSTGFAVIRTLKIVPKYLYQYLTSDYVTKFLSDIAEEQVTTFPAFTPKDLRELKSPYPSPPEQARIATVLSWFDDLIENKKRQNEILENTAMAIFKSWFVDFEPFKDQKFVYSEELDREIPEGWEVKAIGDISHINNGLSYSGKEKFSEPVKDGLIFITLNNAIEGGGFKPVYAWIKSSRIKARHLVKEGDLIIPNTEQTKDERLLGSPGIVFFPPEYTKEYGVFSHHLSKISPITPNLVYYLYLFLKFTREDSASFSTGTGVLGIDINNFKINKYVLLPPQPILQKFHSLVEPLFQKIITNQKEIMVLRKIRDALLPQLVFGKLRVVEI